MSTPPGGMKCQRSFPGGGVEGVERVRLAIPGAGVGRAIGDGDGASDTTSLRLDLLARPCGHVDGVHDAVVVADGHDTVGHHRRAGSGCPEIDLLIALPVLASGVESLPSSLPR
jgi:hypothetical protein